MLEYVITKDKNILNRIKKVDTYFYGMGCYYKLNNKEIRVYGDERFDTFEKARSALFKSLSEKFDKTELELRKLRAEIQEVFQLKEK